MAKTPKKPSKPARKALPRKRAPTKTTWKKAPAKAIAKGEVRNPEGKNQYGTEYKPEYVLLAAKMCELGATTADLADAIGCNIKTIKSWIVRHEEFAEAVKTSKEAYDARVERGLAERAIGYEFDDEKVFCFQGQIITHKTRTHVPPDVTAAWRWLTNRKKERWSDTSKHEISGPDGGPIETESRSDLEVARRIAFALTKADRAAKAKTIEHE